VLSHTAETTIDVCGVVSYGGVPWSKALKRRIAFVEQEDVVFPSLTVREALTFAARLRLPAGEGGREHQAARVEEIIALLKMSKCADTRIGDSDARGVSGGERKRACIGMELLTEPHIVCFDEPTSGLDSSMALHVAQCMADLASQGLTVVTSIHQPSSQVYSLFHKLLLLDEGRVKYRGIAREAAPFFEQRGMLRPLGYSDPDYVMELVTTGELLGGISLYVHIW